MSILYNAHTDGDNYRITKFNDGEVESSYLCSITECQCPAGSRPICRHRLMLPMFLDRGAVDTFWFLDFERKGWVSNEPADAAYRGFENKSAYEKHYSDIANYRDELSSMEQYVLEAECERSELGSSDLESAALVIQQYDAESDSVSMLSAEELIEVALPKPSWRRI